MTKSKLSLRRDPGAIQREGGGGLLAVAVLAPIVGAASGLVGAVFRLSLASADQLRAFLIARVHPDGFRGFLFIVAVSAGAVALAAWLVRRLSPYASGSGIPQVEAALKDELPPAPPRLVFVKFSGGLLAIGSGLALGREGPSVQMGAAIAHMVGKLCRRNWADRKVLIAAGAGAGLATAFNAPIAGAVFVLEELMRHFHTRSAIAALGASAAAIAVARTLLGQAPDFSVAPTTYVDIPTWLLFAMLGAAAGLAGMLYNAALLYALSVADRLHRWPVEIRAALIGAAVGALGWFLPDVIGGGDNIAQRALVGGTSIAFLPLAFLLRFVLGPLSYAAGAPGGLFAPILALGAQLGLLAATSCGAIFSDLHLDPTAFAVVGMAAFFTGVVQAPITGIILVTEMTAGFPMLLPMLGACFTAMLIPNLLGGMPIYDSLRPRALRLQKATVPAGDARTPAS